MKKFITAVIAMAMACTMLASCAASDKPSTASSKSPNSTADNSSIGNGTAPTIAKGDKIGVSMTSRSAERWLRDGNTLEAELKKSGYEVDLQYADSKVEMQVQQIENMILGGCKAIVVAPVDNSALTTVLKTAKEENILIIDYDLDIIGTKDIDYFVGFDNTKVGAMQANAIIENLGLDKGEKGPFYIEMFAGSLAETNCYYYFNGAMEVFKPYMDEGKLIVKSGQTTIEQCTVVDWKLELLTSRLDNLLTAFYSDGTKLNAVLSPSDYLSGPIATRLIDFGYGDEDMPMPLITGNDATQAVCQMIVKEQITMSVFKDTRLLCSAVVSILDALAEGKEVPVNGTYKTDTAEIPTIFVEMYSLNKDNMKELAIDTGFYKEEQIYTASK